MLANPDVNDDTDYLETVIEGATFQWKHSRLSLGGDLKSHIVTPSKFNNCPLFDFPEFQVDVLVHWMTLGWCTCLLAVTAGDGQGGEGVDGVWKGVSCA